MADRPPTRFEHYRAKAQDLVRNPEDVGRLAANASEKLRQGTGWSAKFRAVRDDLALLIDLLGAYTRGDYTAVSKRSLVTVAAGVLYFLMPFDVLPDFIVGLGLLDDAAVIGYVVSVVREELDAYRRWIGDDDVVG